MVNSRVPFNRLMAVFAVTVMVLSLVLSGGGAAAQAPEATASGPEPREGSHVPGDDAYRSDNPGAILSTDAYPMRLPDAPQLAAAADLDAWSANWANGRLCGGTEQCLVGDFNGDQRDDVAVVYGDGRVGVALNRPGGGFTAVTPWSSALCQAGHVCKVGDFNADGKEDIVDFEHGANESAGRVWVALSFGNSFAPRDQWHDLFCIRTQICEVGNVDGAYGDDLILFFRNDVPGINGRVDVALAGALGGFGPAQKWHNFFCINDEECHVADVNGDGRADILLFVKSGSDAGRVSIALAPTSGATFGGAQTWAIGFCYGGDTCSVGDFDGNGAADLVRFVRTPTAGTSFGEVYVYRSNRISSFGDAERWKGPFCGATDDCAVGDFNGDGKKDIIRFVKQSADPGLVGAAYVAVAGGEPFGFVPTPAPDGKWLDKFCFNSEQCGVGDFNGDGLSDIVSFTRSSTGDVYVSLNVDGTHFAPRVKWQDYACLGSDICKVGRVDGDSKDDLIVFSRTQTGPVYVHRSTGFSFLGGEVWNQYFCILNEICQVGDFNGDGLTDIALFIRSAYGTTGDRQGDVEVAINTGYSFVPTGVWQPFFCVGNEVCDVGDFNADGKDDIITFVKGNASGATPKVYVALSNGSKFSDGQLWNNFFCQLNEVCAVGDVNGDGSDDILAFVQAGYPASNPSSPGDVYVGISQGSQQAGGFVAQKWHDFFCYTGEVCATGYFNYDRRADIIAFRHDSTEGTVWVALASAGTGYYFADAIPAPADAKRVYIPMIFR